MVTLEDVIQIIKKDENLATLVEGIKPEESLMKSGFDSLDVMMISVLLDDEYHIDIQVKKDDSLNSIVEKVNSFVNA